MKFLQSGENVFLQEADGIELDTLPANVYNIVAMPMMKGLYLHINNMNLNTPERVYGSNFRLIPRIFDKFKNSSKSLGVLLEGEKGMGKSLYMKLLIKKALEEGYPVINVTFVCDDVIAFINKIKQDCLITIDEFDKTRGCENNDNQDNKGILSLLDGTASVGKKLFIATSNEIQQGLYSNRPGRFYYKLNFGLPSNDDIISYMKDNIKEEYAKDIKKYANFARMSNLNYDCLEALCSELNCGVPLEEVITYLNISGNIGLNGFYNFQLEYEDGTTDNSTRATEIYTSVNNTYTIFSRTVPFENYKRLQIEFDTERLNIDDNGTLYLDGSGCKIRNLDSTEKVPLKPVKLIRLIKEDVGNTRAANGVLSAAMRRPIAIIPVPIKGSSVYSDDEEDNEEGTVCCSDDFN